MSFYSTEGVVESAGSKVFKPGVSVVKFNGAKFEPAKKDGSGDKVLTFYFVDDTGAEMNYKHWEVKMENAKGLAGKPHLSNRTLKINGKEFIFKKDAIITEQESVAITFDTFNKITKHVTNRFDESINISGNSYIEYSNNVVKALTPHIGKEVKIATEYKGAYLNIRTKQPFLANIEDISTLEKLSLKTTKDEVTPDNDDAPSALTPSTTEVGW